VRGRNVLSGTSQPGSQLAMSPSYSARIETAAQRMNLRNENYGCIVMRLNKFSIIRRFSWRAANDSILIVNDAFESMGDKGS
jgi:hypothetical protein